MCQAIRRLGAKLRWKLHALTLADVTCLAVVFFPEEQEVDEDNQTTAIFAPCAAAQRLVGPAANHGIGKLVDGDQNLFYVGHESWGIWFNTSETVGNGMLPDWYSPSRV